MAVDVGWFHVFSLIGVPPIFFNPMFNAKDCMAAETTNRPAVVRGNLTFKDTRVF